MEFLTTIKYVGLFIIGNIGIYITVRLITKAIGLSWFEAKCQYDTIPKLQKENGEKEKENEANKS